MPLRNIELNLSPPIPTSAAVRTRPSGKVGQLVWEFDHHDVINHDVDQKYMYVFMFPWSLSVFFLLARFGRKTDGYSFLMYVFSNFWCVFLPRPYNGPIFSLTTLFICSVCGTGSVQTGEPSIANKHGCGLPRPRQLNKTPPPKLPAVTLGGRRRCNGR